MFFIERGGVDKSDVPTKLQFMSCSNGVLKILADEIVYTKLYPGRDIIWLIWRLSMVDLPG